jgi:hypothetical protein
MSSAVDPGIDALIAGELYARSQADKERELLAVLRTLCLRVAQGCPEWARFLERAGSDVAGWTRLDDIPPLPVSMFKEFELRAVPREEIQRELNSSATTGDRPSRILVDRTTANLQTRALAAVLKERLGARRRPYLVLDCAESAAAGDVLSARGAAIRGLASFARETSYALQRSPAGDGDLELDHAALESFFAEHAGAPMLLFGFTFMVWTRVLLKLRDAGLRFDASQGVLLHSGGWKKLQEQAVDRATFARAAHETLALPPAQVVDFYGMVEQVGTVFLDCEVGHKHAPAFADVLIRRPGTLARCDAGEVGLIEVISVLPHSYPGQAIMTEDQGELLGVDDCPCGRRGTYFRFTKRVERVAVRGCGDTFAQMRGAR